MCGITLIITDERNEHDCKEELKRLKCGIERRGPDASRSLEVDFPLSRKGTFCGNVLWLQGSEPTLQPLVGQTGNILLWNGDSYNGLTQSISESDTCALMRHLDQSNDLPGILRTLESIHGPWCIVFYNPTLQKIIIGRDSRGRHSLLWNVSELGLERIVGPVIVSSLAKHTSRTETYSEVPCYGIFVYDLVTETIHCHPWFHSLDILPIGVKVAQPELHSPYYAPLCKLSPSEFDLVNWSATSETENEFDRFQAQHSETISAFERVLRDAVELRLRHQPPYCRNCIPEFLAGKEDDSLKCSHVKNAVLFSGGLDSVILAALADHVLPDSEPVDLYNVAFEQIKKGTQNRAIKLDKFQVPDRLSGLDALEELKVLNPRRTWNFVEINVSLTELTEARPNHIAGLIYPSSTVLDDSIGCAQWFAAKGDGIIMKDGTPEPYSSTARVVLMGAGADEQLGGYSRHRVKFSSSENWSALTQELEMEMSRISSRNLGRDNRVISDHGRALRLPFLDENVVAMLARLPVWQKADLRLKPGIGDKILLRTLAWKLGLKRTATRVKRAIQFGSRIAKAESRHEKGADVCSRLL